MRLGLKLTLKLDRSEPDMKNLNWTKEPDGFLYAWFKGFKLCKRGEGNYSIDATCKLGFSTVDSLIKFLTA